MMAVRSRNTLFTCCKGLSLLELQIALLIGAILLVGLVQVAAAARSSYRLQESLAELQESERHLTDNLAAVLRQSDFRPQPWNVPTVSIGLAADTADDVSNRTDRVALRTWSEHNCFGSRNTDSDGNPLYFLREHILSLNSSGNLAHTCRYGPAQTEMVTQIRNQGLLENIEVFQALYAEDVDGDGLADRWVKGGQWNDESRVVGMQLGFLIRTNQVLSGASSASFSVLDKSITAPADGHLRRVVTYSMALRGRANS